MNRDIARIIDANFNRTREALRVMEDYARFVMGDPGGSGACKRFRHDFSEAIRQLPDNELLSARDTPGDVGTTLTTPGEAHRADARAVCVAAAKRLSEALRTIEEYGKAITPEFAAGIEALRYRSYELEQRVLLRAERAGRFARAGLYVLVTESLCRAEWFATAVAAIDGGAGCLQLREKNLSDGELLLRARRMAELCRSRDVLFIMNDRPDLAVLADADGVHLGQEDMAVADARRIVGPDRLIGISTHNPGQLAAAIESSPDYIAVGPMFQSTTKPQDHVPGPDLLAEAVQQSTVPVVAIGGITAHNTDVLRAAGARVFVSVRPSSAHRMCDRLRRLLRGHDPMTMSWDSLEHMQDQREWRIPIPPTCRNCGYNLTGMTRLTCPECGQSFSWHEVRRRAGRIWSTINHMQHAGPDAQLGLKIQVGALAALALSRMSSFIWLQILISLMVIGAAGLGIILGAQTFNIRRIPKNVRHLLGDKRPSILIGTLVVMLGIALLGAAIAWW